MLRGNKWTCWRPLIVLYLFFCNFIRLHVCRFPTHNGFIYCKSLSFTLGVANLASPKIEEDLLESPLLDQGSLWSTDLGWDQTSLGEPFFDQVAELEKLIPGENCKGHLFGKSWVANTELFNGEEVDKWVGPTDIDDSNQAAGICGSALTGHLLNPGDEDDTESKDMEIIEQQACKLSTVLSGEATALFDVSQGSPSSVGSSCSDEASEKRIRNNQASRKFRRARKERHHTLFARAVKLEQENQLLKLQVKEMIQEIVSLKSMLPKNTVHVWLFWYILNVHVLRWAQPVCDYFRGTTHAMVFEVFTFVWNCKFRQPRYTVFLNSSCLNSKYGHI